MASSVLRVTPVSDTMVIPSSRGEQLWCPQRSEVWDGEMETEGENCIKISDSNVYGGAHVAIPHPASSSHQQQAAAIGSKINVRNSSELYKIVRHES